jgi:hypothetical protein
MAAFVTVRLTEPRILSHRSLPDSRMGLGRDPGADVASSAYTTL